MKIDRLLFNGKIHTMDPRAPVVDSIAIMGDKIVATGGNEIRQKFEEAEEKVDLQNKTVIPGLIDAHAHLQLYTQSRHTVDLIDTRTVQEALTRIETFVGKNRGSHWIQGWGWCQDQWPDGLFPTASMIDAICAQVPVTLTARSGHASWSNSLALACAGITRDTPDPVGGRILRDASGMPTGILLDEAHKLVENAIPPMPVDDLASRMETTIRSLNEVGVTGIHDFDGANSFRALQILRQKDALSLRVVKQILVEYLEDALSLGLCSGFGDDNLRIGAIKIFADGALGPRTAAMFEPYEGEAENRGVVVTEKEDLIHLAGKASLAGWACAIHAIGDRAVHDVLDAYETVRGVEREAGIPVEERRHRIEHVQLIHPEDAGRLGALGIIASMQPIHATSDIDMADQHWGSRAVMSYNWRLQLEHGATLVFGSDAPVETIDPFAGIHAAVTRRRKDGSPGPDGWRSDNNGRLTLQEALHAYTVGPAFASGLEDRLGRLAPGYLADLLVLNQDMFAVEPMEIINTKPVAVMIGGKWVVINL